MDGVAKTMTIPAQSHYMEDPAEQYKPLLKICIVRRAKTLGVGYYAA